MILKISNKTFSRITRYHYQIFVNPPYHPAHLASSTDAKVRSNPSILCWRASSTFAEKTLRLDGRFRNPNLQPVGANPTNNLTPPRPVVKKRACEHPHARAFVPCWSIAIITGESWKCVLVRGNKMALHYLIQKAMMSYCANHRW